MERFLHSWWEVNEMAEKGEALKGSASITSAQAVLEKFDSLHYYRSSMSTKVMKKRSGLTDLLRCVWKRRNEFVMALLARSPDISQGCSGYHSIRSSSCD